MFAHTPAVKSWHWCWPECQLGNSFSAACSSVSEGTFSPGCLETEALQFGVSVWHFWQKREELVFIRLIWKSPMTLFMIGSLKRKTLKPLETKSCLLKVPVKHKNIKMQVRSNTWDYMVLTVLSPLGQSWWDHSQWRAALQSLLPKCTIITAPPINRESLDYGDSSAAAMSLTGKAVHLFPKWTAELGYSSHRYNCLSIPPVNAEVFPLLSLKVQPEPCSWESPGYKDPCITAGQREASSSFLTYILRFTAYWWYGFMVWDQESANCQVQNSSGL